MDGGGKCERQQGVRMGRGGYEIRWKETGVKLLICNLTNFINVWRRRGYKDYKDMLIANLLLWYKANSKRFRLDSLTVEEKISFFEDDIHMFFNYNPTPSQNHCASLSYLHVITMSYILLE